MKNLRTHSGNNSVITVHGIRDDYRTAWIDREGSWWIKNKLFHDLSARQIDYSYEIHENSDLYETDGLRLHAERLTTAYANVRRELEDVGLQHHKITHVSGSDKRIID